MADSDLPPTLGWSSPPQHCFSIARVSPTEVWVLFILTHLWAPQNQVEDLVLECITE